MGKRLIMFVLGVFSCLLVQAQVKTVTGTVTSADNGEPLLGVSVSVPGTTVGVNTDANGKFTLSHIPASAKVLRFSFIGMEAQELPIKSVMNVQLKSSDYVLKGAVVTALGIKRDEKSLGYSATKVDNEDITAARNADIMTGLQGKVAGLDISSTGTGPGSSTSVIIRGFSSLGGNNQPLYVIDGVPVDNPATTSSDGVNEDQLNHHYDFGNGAAAINPDDVAEMTVLKGAAATALYGSRAANGVIMITTKKGSKHEKGLGVSYNGGIQFTQVARLVEMQNMFGQGAYGEHVAIENGSWGPRFDGVKRVYGYVYNNTQRVKSYRAIKNNIRDFFDTGITFNNSVSFNGATDKSDYFVSLSNVNDNGIYPTRADSYNKYTFSARGSYEANKKLTFSSSINYTYSKNSAVAGGQKLSPIFSLYNVPRDISVTAQEDLSDPFNSPGYYFTPYNATNPYYQLKNWKDTYEQDKIWGKFQADYKLFDFLTLTYRVGLDHTGGKINSGVPNMSALFPGTPNWTANQEIGTNYGSYFTRDIRRREVNQDVMVNFSKPIEDFNVNAIVGFNTNERKYEWNQEMITNLDLPTWFNVSNSGETPSIRANRQHRRLMGLYGQVEGSWKDMVYLTVTARNDWSSTLPKKNNSYFYPGITGSFIFTELLNKDIRKYISFGKFRVAWGKTGNDASPYMTGTTFTQATSDASGWGEVKFPLGGVNAFTASNSMGNNNLKPEMTTEWELGLNMAFFRNRLAFDFAYYNRSTKNQIISMNMDHATGYSSRSINLGEISNKGVEFLLTGTPIKTKDWQWDLAWNISHNSSKVVDLPSEVGNEVLIFGLSGGTSMYAVKGKPLGTFKAQTFEKDPQGRVVVNASTGLPVQNSTLEYCGDMNRKYSMGISSTLRWKGLSLTADLDIRKGGKMFCNTKSVTYFTGIAKQTIYNDRNTFIVPNSVNKVTDPTTGAVSYVENTTPLTYENIQTYWADLYDRDGSDLVSKDYVKLRNVVITWQLPKKWLAKTPFTDISVSVFGRNLITWTPDDNTFVDPESSTLGNDLEGQFGEYTVNPSTRTYGFNLNLKF